MTPIIGYPKRVVISNRQCDGREHRRPERKELTGAHSDRDDTFRAAKDHVLFENEGPQRAEDTEKVSQATLWVVIAAITGFKNDIVNVSATQESYNEILRPRTS